MLLFSFDVTVMIAVPLLTAVTKPSLLTTATLVLLLLKITPLFVALAGSTVAFSSLASFSSSSSSLGFTVMPVTGTSTGVEPTLTVQVAYLPLPSFAAAVIIAVPSLTAVTRPVLLTVATASLLEEYLMLWLAVVGCTLALSWAVSFSFRFRELGSSVTPAAISSTLRVMLLLAPLPSLAVAVIVAEPAPVAITLPSASTVATVAALDVKVMPLSVAFSGEMLAVTLVLSPTFSVVLPADRLISPTFCFTVT